VIYHQRQCYAIKAMCRYFGVSRAAYYTWVKRLDKPEQDVERQQWVREAYLASRRIYGYRRIGIWIRRQKGVVLNHKAVLRLMNRLGLHSIARRRKVYTRWGDQEIFQHYPNVLARDFSATRPNQKWVTDVTYIATRQGWAYLSTIKDLYDGFIVAHEIGRGNTISLVLNTLRKASRSIQRNGDLLLHSDQGFQYASKGYHVLAQELSITPSMSRRGNCWDNAVMENFFGHLKEEALRHVRYPSFEELQQIVDDYVQFYNYERIQLKTRQTPFETRCLPT
jgi:transposase InsO family protein